MTVHELPEGLQGTIITDCSDPNAEARQKIRFTSLFGVMPTFIRLGAINPDLEAAGHLVDALDALQTPAAYPQNPAIVLVNVAPRGDDVKEKWENGTPFCHFETGKTTVVSAYEGRSLALVRKLGLVGAVNLLDTAEVTDSLVTDGILTADQAHDINNTQFRSLEFLQLAARELIGGRSLPSKEVGLEEQSYVEGRAWFVDNFNNVKTTLLPWDIDYEEGQTVTLEGGEEVTCYRRLTDVPTGRFGLTIGSSGYARQRWLEIVKQKGHAAEDLGLKIGDGVLET